MATKKKATKKKARKKSPGRPTKATPEKKKKVIELTAKGATDAEISKIVGVHPNTLTNWRGQDKEYREILQKHDNECSSALKMQLFRKAYGFYHPEIKIAFKDGEWFTKKYMKYYPPDTSALIFWLKNKKPDEWKDTRFFDENYRPVNANGEVKKSFKQFCIDAGYPPPFEMQIEMMRFGMDETDARLLLGSRGYGKTDYVVILGIAYDIYLDPMGSTNLIVSKSEERNSAMLSEIANACELNGVKFSKKNSTCIRVAGLIGKDHSVSSITIGSTSVRGRHPKRVVMDDPVTEDDVAEATRRKVQRLYNELNKLTPNVLVIGQPVHRLDLYGHLRPLLKKMEVPHGSIPELDHDLEAMKLAGVSWESISASYHLKIISESNTPFEKVQFINHFPEAESAVAFIDPSFEGGDYTGLTIAKAHFDGVAVKGHVFKKAWNHCLDEMVHLMAAANVKRVGFETNSLGDQPVIMLRQALPEGVGVVGKKSVGQKHARIMNAGVFSHLIYIARTSDQKYIDQVVNYEYGAKFDDGPDSLASLLEWLGLVRGVKISKG